LIGGPCVPADYTVLFVMTYTVYLYHTRVRRAVLFWSRGGIYKSRYGLRKKSQYFNSSYSQKYRFFDYIAKTWFFSNKWLMLKSEHYLWFQYNLYELFSTYSKPYENPENLVPGKILRNKTRQEQNQRFLTSHNKLQTRAKKPRFGSMVKRSMPLFFLTVNSNSGLLF